MTVIYNRMTMTRLSLILIIFYCEVGYTQPLARWDGTASLGVSTQFSKLLNEKFDAGPYGSFLLAWRVQENSGLSLCIGVDHLRSTFGSESSQEDVHATFYSVGLRFETRRTRTSFNPYLLLAFGSGSAQAKKYDNQLNPSLRNSAITFGVGFATQISDRLALVPMIRVVIGEGSGFSIPVAVGLKVEL